MKTVKQFCDELLATYGEGERILVQHVSEIDGDVSFWEPDVKAMRVAPLGARGSPYVIARANDIGVLTAVVIR